MSRPDSVDRARRWLDTPPRAPASAATNESIFQPSLFNADYADQQENQNNHQKGSPSSIRAASIRSQHAEQALLSSDCMSSDVMPSSSFRHGSKKSSILPVSTGRSKTPSRPGSRNRSKSPSRPGSRDRPGSRGRSKSPSRPGSRDRPSIRDRPGSRGRSKSPSRPGSRGRSKSPSRPGSRAKSRGRSRGSSQGKGKSSGSPSGFSEFISPEKRKEINDRSRARRLRPAFAACEAGDFETLVNIVTDAEKFGDMPHSEERTLCINAIDSAIKEQTFLHIAAYYGYLDIAQLFCSFPELNIEAVDWHGMTPLLLAAKKNNVAVAKVILRRGGDPEKCDKFGRSLLLFSRYPTVHSLLVETRTDRVDQTAASLKWANEVECDLSNCRMVLNEQEESRLMSYEDVRKRWILAMRKYRSMKTRVENAIDDTKKANHGVIDARKVLQEEVDRRNEAVAKTKKIAKRTIDIIDMYHECHVRMTLAKKKHDKLVRKRAEVRALAASKVGIVDAMRRLAPLCVKAQSFCCLALRVVTSANPIECAKVVVRGGVEGLLASMGRFPSNVVIQREGCSALANLVQLNAYAREELNSMGGIRIVFSALRFLKDSAETQSSGMRLLCGLIGALETSR
jgi:hypothetical protein